MLSPGDRLGSYEVVSPLGAGGMGEVYRAHDTRLGRDVALKVLPSGALADEPARKRFRKEAQALSRLSHPHIATLYDFDCQDGVDYLVMELVPGPSLDTRLKHGPLPEKEVVRLGSQVARALVAAHELGIVHRDLKPQNLRLTADGLVKVLDFGLALLPPTGADGSVTDTASRGAAGTPPYMSPEQLLGRDVDVRTDVYATGVTLYEMATGRRPFGEAGGPQLVAKILTEEPPQPRDVNPTLSPQLEQVILKATDKEPDLRHQTAKDLLVDLERLVAQAPSPSSGARARSDRRAAADGTSTKHRFGGQLRLGLGLIAGATLVALAGAVVFSLRPSSPRIVGFRTLTQRIYDVGGLVTDGTNAYFAEARLPRMALYVVPLSGGEPREIDLPWQGDLCVYLFDLIPQPPALLIGKWASSGWQLWRLPLGGGAPSRFGSLPDVSSARLSRRGDRIAYIAPLESGSEATALFVAGADGSAPRRLVGGKPGHPLWLVGWQPGDASLRYLSNEDSTWFWDVASDGSGGARKAAPAGGLTWALPRDTGFWDAQLDWTPDGRFFVHADERNLVARREKDLHWGASGQAATSLAAPSNVFTLRFTPDGRRIVAFVHRPGAQVVRFDLRTRQVTPLLGGARAGVAEFSPDGAWVAWVSNDGGRRRLWRSRPDGSAALPLTDPARLNLEAWHPVFWSPDGRRVAFAAWGDPPESKPSPQLFLADVEAGTVERLAPEEPGLRQFEGCWAPDGRSLVYDDPFRPDAEVYVRRVDLVTRQVTKLPGSEGLMGPKCSRDGRILGVDLLAQRAENGPRSHFKVRDPASGRWTAVAIKAQGVNYPTWSRDGRFVYATASAPDRSVEIIRFDVTTRRVEHVARIDGLGADVWMNLTPDGVPLVHRDVSQREIVVMDWEVR